MLRASSTSQYCTAGDTVFNLKQFARPALGQSASGSVDAETPKPVPLSKLKDGFLDGTSSTYLEELEERYRQDPGSVDKSWSSFFRSLGIALCHFRSSTVP